MHWCFKFVAFVGSGAVLACAAAPGEDVDFLDQGLPKPSGRVGDADYCINPAALCVAGEGDCDSGAECATGYCGRDNGPKFALAAGLDICVPAHCGNRRRDGDETQIDCGGSCGSTCPAIVCPTGATTDRCSSDCPCPLGGTDCDRPEDCAAGLTCVGDLGAQFGHAATWDVCAPAHCANHRRDGDETQIDCGGSCGSACPAIACPSQAGPDRCSIDCPCTLGGTDCDRTDDCATGLVCVGDLGAQFGHPATWDVCAAAHCQNGYRDGDETQIDCGGSCGSSCPPIVCQTETSKNRCTDDCPCTTGEGDCDRDSGCASQLVCIEGNGPSYGLPAGWDACAPAHCANGQHEPDLGETDIDCGGICGICTRATFRLTTNETGALVIASGDWENPYRCTPRFGETIACEWSFPIGTYLRLESEVPGHTFRERTTGLGLCEIRDLGWPTLVCRVTLNQSLQASLLWASEPEPDSR